MLPDLVHRAGRQVGQREGAVGGADQAGDLEAEMFEDAADFAILALPEAHLDPTVAAGAALQIGVDRAVAHALDLDAVDQLLKLRLADLAEHAGAVAALDAGRGQFQLALQFPVGGQQQQPLGVEIEPPDRHQPGQALGETVINGRAALGIALGGEQARGLVVAEQAGRRRLAHGLAVDGDAVERGEQRGRGFDRRAVYRDPPLADHPLDLAPRGDAGPGEQFGDALGIFWGGHGVASRAVRSEIAFRRLRDAARAAR